MQALVVPPGDPLQGRRFQGLHGLERRGASDQFCFVRPVGALGQREGARVTHRAGGRQDPRFLEVRTLQCADVLGAVIRVVDRAAGVAVPGRPRDRPVQGDQGKRAGVLAGGYRPAHDPPGARVGGATPRTRNSRTPGVTMVMSATCGRPGASAVNRRRTRSMRPPRLPAGRVVVGIRPRRTPWTPRERITLSTWSRPMPLQPWRLSCMSVFRYPYTAMNRCAWIVMTSRARAS